MHQDDLLVLNGEEVERILSGAETALVDVVRTVYEAHARGETTVPHSLFLTFPDDARSRIIALPAYVGGDFDVAGMKWVSSFPANIERGLERASALVIVNSLETGRPVAVMEGSTINARRTAASAVLAASRLHAAQGPVRLGMIGCGRISFEILRFLLATGFAVEVVTAHDLSQERAERFVARCDALAGRGLARTAGLQTVLADSDLIAFATTAPSPYLDDLAPCRPGATILHVSLRDLAPAAILASDNVVDDVDHVCRAGTSVHLAAEATGTRDFVRCTIGEVLLGSQPARSDDRHVVFSPFGLGILDVATAALVLRRAREAGLGVRLDGFWPRPWTAAT
jgi:ornithine cyclodeaminase